MLRFKTFLLEYITDKQRERYKGIKMIPEARAAIDHFFGVGNDKVHGEIANDDKSEIHKQLETHLGQTISHEDYSKGTIKDRYGRDVRIGRMISDNGLRNQFDHDPARKTATSPSFKTSTVRGIEVAGQTNPSPDAQHPNGHSWADISCKNVEDGINKHYLEDEIRNGTVVHFVHDHNGQEIYRATLQPHRNKEGQVAYAVDSEYGIKHPKFTADAHRVAEQLSGEYRPGVYRKVSDVYNDNDKLHILHPKTTAKDIDKTLKTDHHSATAEAILNNKSLTPKHVDTLTKSENQYTRRMAIEHPFATAKHIDKALNDEDWQVRADSLRNPNATAEHVTRAFNDRNHMVKVHALNHPLITAEQVASSQDHPEHVVRAAAARSPKATEGHVTKALDDPSSHVRSSAAANPNATAAQISKGLEDSYWSVSGAAASNPNATTEHLHKALDSEDHYTRMNALNNPKATREHLVRALNDSSPLIRDIAKEKLRRT